MRKLIFLFILLNFCEKFISVRISIYSFRFVLWSVSLVLFNYNFHHGEFSSIDLLCNFMIDVGNVFEFVHFKL